MIAEKLPLEQLKEFEKREYEKMEIEFLTKDFASRHGKPLVAVLADIGKKSRENQLNFLSFGQSRTTTCRPQISYTQPTMSTESRNERDSEAQDEIPHMTNGPNRDPGNYFPQQYHRQPYEKGGYVGRGTGQKKRKPRFQDTFRGIQ
ncbi:hypothetical protein Golomagni_03174 [Golovinomyces magnicellulatus]|nr:hypothetical protein Golomagni_03174 [Golovinomyces magnicellulatus]